MIKLVDTAGQEFITRQENVFVIGKEKPMVTLPNTKGVRVSIDENRAIRLAKLAKKTQE